jgi:UDP-2-acetamido-3-amino-2,3-dideoxy-glucuronate N-acetyltransferase
VHRTAEVEKGARLGAGTVVWRYAHVMSGARVGARCMIGQGCFVGSGVSIGDGCRIQNNVSIYQGVELDDDVFVGPAAVFTNVRRPRAAYPRKPAYQTTHVGRGATIGANATIVCGVHIGACALVGAGAVVTTDVPDHAVALGNPARVRGWICACGDNVSRAAQRPRRVVCPRCRLGPRTL